MKKFLLILGMAGILVLSLMGIMPSNTKPGECGQFHPHFDHFGGEAKTLKFLSKLTRSENISVWTDGVKTVVISQFNGSPVYLSYGIGNPTMFIPDRGLDYIREDIQDMNQVTSAEGINMARRNISCLKNSYESALVSTGVSVPASRLSLANLWMWPLAALTALIGWQILKGTKRSAAY